MAHQHVPKENRSPYGSGQAPGKDDTAGAKSKEVGGNPEKRDQQANTEQNTTHQGHQQDR